MGLVAPWHAGSSQTRARIHVSCIVRRIPSHCTTREALHPFVDGRLGNFHLLVILNIAAMNIGVLVSVPIFHSLVFIPRSGIAVSRGCSRVTLLCNGQIVFPRGCPMFHAFRGSSFSKPSLTLVVFSFKKLYPS